MKKGIKGYSALFIFPSFILFTVFIVIPIILSIYYSLTKWNGISEAVFIWLDNYKKLFNKPEFFLVLKNSFILIILGLVTQLPFALIISYLIFKTRKGAKFFRAVYFLPVVIAPAAIGVMFTLFFNGDIGPINQALARIGLESLQIAWLADQRVVLYVVIFPMLWQYIGFYVLIYLAALYSLPKELFESAVLDGANSFQVFKSIVVPLLRDIIGVTTVLSFTSSIKAFDHAYIMTWGGPGFSSSFIGLYLYRVGFYNANFGYGSSIAVILLLIAIVFTILLRRFAFQQRFEF